MDPRTVILANVLSHWVWPILQFLVGLGVVIFVHELGHFLAAKAAGIKVERFAVGFGPRLFGLVRGGTDYCVNALPVGGYVKMLGQEDVKPLKDQYADPRAFNNKPVGARLMVISAGVVMNVILAAILFVVVCMVGKSFPAAVVGGVSPGWPAASAKIVWDAAKTRPDGGAATQPAVSVGLRPGDKILAINGEPIKRFDILKIKAALARRDETFTLRIEREIDGAVRRGSTRIGVKALPGGMLLAFGIHMPSDTVIALDESVRGQTRFRTGDRVTAIAGRPVRHHWDIRRIAATLDGSPVKVRVRRTRPGGGEDVDVTVAPILRSSPRTFFTPDGGRFRGDLVGIDADGGAYDVLLEGGRQERFGRRQVTSARNDELLDILGMAPRFRVGGVVKGSPAEKAGLKAGDIVLSYGDRPVPTFAEFRRINKRFAGKGTTIIVRRGDQTSKLWVVPGQKKGQALVGVLASADLSHPVVAWVRPGSPAEKAGIEPQARILAVTGADPGTGASTERKIDTWTDLYRALRQLTGREVSIRYAVGVRRATANLGVLDETMFDPRDYEFRVFDELVGFRPLRVKLVKRNPLAALAWSVRETWHMIVSSYASLRALVTGTASYKTAMGVVGIGGVAVSAGREGAIEVVYFMSFVSVVVAVFNFLPIPVVDGGHAVFLLIEKIRGRPVPVRVVNIIQTAGLVLLLGVFVLVTWNDILRLVGE